MPARAALVIVLSLALLPCQQACADLVVVVSARSGVERLSTDEVINIFMGRYRKLPSGLPAQPIDLPASLPERARFYRLLVNKDLADISAYWARLIFSGKTSPPLQSGSTAEMMERLTNDRGAVGYMDRSQADPRVRIVLELER